MAIQSIQKNNVTEEVFQQLKSAIASGEWHPGDKIPSENELASKMGVSRVTIRGAIQRLSSIGLIESRQGEGTFVCELNGTQNFNSLLPMMVLTKPNLRNILELRMIIEVAGVALAAERCDEGLLKALRENLERHQATEDLGKAADSDLEFHYIIAKATGNPLIAQIYSILREVYTSAFHEIVAAMGTRNACYYHGTIVQAIEKKDVELARATMMEHIQDTINYLEKAAKC